MGAVKDTIVAAVAGYVGTEAAEQAGTKLMELEPEQDRQREQEVRAGPPFALAADHLATRVFGIDLGDQQRQKVGMALHYAAGRAWAPVSQLLRRRTRTGPVTAGLVTGASRRSSSTRPSPRRSAPPRPTAPTHCRPTSVDSRHTSPSDSRSPS